MPSGGLKRLSVNTSATFSRGLHRAILIGSDIPDLPGEIVTDAFRFLNIADCVIVPSIDGGYYLIGFRNDSLLPEASVACDRAPRRYRRRRRRY